VTNCAILVNRETLTGAAPYAYCAAESEEEAKGCEGYEYKNVKKVKCKHYAWLSGLCNRYCQEKGKR
jgi:hypothetical protein